MTGTGAPTLPPGVSAPGTPAPVAGPGVVDGARAEAPARSPGGEACPLCGAPLAPEQEWCLNCGAAARTRLAATPDWKIPIAVIATVIALSLGVLAAALVKLTGSSGSSAAPVTTTVATAAAPSAAAPSVSAPAATPGASTPAGGAPAVKTPSSTAPGVAGSAGASPTATVPGAASPSVSTSTPSTIPGLKQAEQEALRRIRSHKLSLPTSSK